MKEELPAQAPAGDLESSLSSQCLISEMKNFQGVLGGGGLPRVYSRPRRAAPPVPPFLSPPFPGAFHHPEASGEGWLLTAGPTRTIKFNGLHPFVRLCPCFQWLTFLGAGSPTRTDSLLLLFPLQACKRKEQEPNKDRNNSQKKSRLVFTDLQRRTLFAIFKENKRPSKEMQITISQQLGLELTTVSNFFMNARRRSLEKWQDDLSTGGSSSTSSTCTKA